jgi:hypothetical protein
MIAKMEDIKKRCKPAAGSVRIAYIIVPEDVVDSGMPQTYVFPVISYEPQLDTTARKYVLQMDRNTGVFSEIKKTDNRAGDYYEQKLSFQVRGMRYEVDYTRELLKNRTFHVLYEDYNKQVRLVKNLRVQDEATTGDRYFAKNGYTFNFYTRSVNLAPTIPISLIVFSVQDNGGTGGGNNNSVTSNAWSYTRLPQIQDGDNLLFAKTNDTGQLVGFQWLPSGEYMRHIRGVDQTESSHLNGVGYKSENNVRIIHSFDQNGTPNTNII